MIYCLSLIDIVRHIAPAGIGNLLSLLRKLKRPITKVRFELQQVAATKRHRIVS